MYYLYFSIIYFIVNLYSVIFKNVFNNQLTKVLKGEQSVLRNNQVCWLEHSWPVLQLHRFLPLEKWLENELVQANPIIMSALKTERKLRADISLMYKNSKKSRAYFPENKYQNHRGESLENFRNLVPCKSLNILNVFKAVWPFFNLLSVPGLSKKARYSWSLFSAEWTWPNYVAKFCG